MSHSVFQMGASVFLHRLRPWSPCCLGPSPRSLWSWRRPPPFSLTNINYRLGWGEFLRAQAPLGSHCTLDCLTPPIGKDLLELGPACLHAKPWHILYRCLTLTGMAVKPRGVQAPVQWSSVWTCYITSGCAAVSFTNGKISLKYINTSDIDFTPTSTLSGFLLLPFHHRVLTSVNCKREIPITEWLMMRQSQETVFSVYFPKCNRLGF